MSREEAAANAVEEDLATTPRPSKVRRSLAGMIAADALTAADRHDAAHGIHRVAIRDAKTVEKAARRLIWRIPDLTPTEAMDHVRAVLAAAVEAGQ